MNFYCKYKTLLKYGDDYSKWAHELKKLGYATANHYDNTMLDVIKNTDMDSFMDYSKDLVNNNREMFHKVSYLFDGQPVPENGMYYSAWTTPHTIELLNKLNIKSIKMDISGKDEFLRFNLAQINEVTNEAINLILKEDSIL